MSKLERKQIKFVMAEFYLVCDNKYEDTSVRFYVVRFDTSLQVVAFTPLTLAVL
jgi:hypothetical protein